MIQKFLKIALLVAFAAAPGTLFAQTRFEAEAVGTPRGVDDICGYDSINGVVGRSADASASGGEVLFTCGTSRNFKFLFYGTGCDVIVIGDTNTGSFNYILDEGAQSGTTNTLAASRLYNQAYQLFAPGSLPNTLHTLEIQAVGDGCIILDALDVYNSNVPTRVENTRTDLITYTGGWVTGDTTGDAAEEASGGSVAYSVNPGDSIELTFTGTAVAISGVSRDDARQGDWEIDNGAYSGTFDLPGANALNYGLWHRWPFILANNLPNGTHVLKITVGAGASAFNFDAIDIVGTAGSQPDPPTRFEIEANGTPRGVDDICGYDSINGVVAREADGSASGGEVLFTCGANRNFKFLFYGSGCDLVTVGDSGGAGGSFNWVLDEGAQSGSSSTVTPTRTYNNKIALFPAGSLARTLHTLEIRPVGDGCIILDALDVYDAGVQTRIEGDNTARINYTGTWELVDTGSDSAAEASGGSCTYTLNTGDSFSFDFTGTAVALLHQCRWDAKEYSWSIDNGAYSGTFHVGAANALAYGFWHRWPFVLKNNLPNGPHTVTITATANGPGAFNFDAIDVIESSEPAPTAVRESHWELY